MIVPPELDADVATYRRRIEAAETWASAVYARSLNAARSRLHVGRRAARYRHLELYFLDQLASPSRAQVEEILYHMLDRIEADTYGEQPIPVPEHLVALVNEGLKHAA